ncbi:MAG: PAS domain S-box protein [Melioribacteraceae bacterium]|nr:PAS domain S-box protein [Melioribacteraceae bacterium]MCO6472581.1 PAS domain S-box protein [Melioribacteraceae bacterium]
MPDSNLLTKEDLIEILDSLDVGIIYVDKENRFAFVNKAGEEIRFIKATDRIGKSVLECHSAGVRKKVVEDMNSFKIGDYASRHKMIRSKGKYFDNSYSVVKDSSEGFKGVVLVSQDVTEKIRLERELKKANEELEHKVEERTKEITEAYEKLKIANDQLMQSEKMAAIGQFVSGVAHEINNPLDGIQNCIRAVMSNSGNHKLMEDYLPLALEGLFKIEIVVKRLLDYARPHSKEKIIVDLNELIYNSLELTKFRIKKKKIDMRLNLNDEPIYIYGEPHYLGQVFVNLIMNSYDAVENEGNITISTERIDDQIEISLSDNGQGISEENLSKIFDPFFTTKQKDNGTGLGLYLSYNVIKEHGGEISVESKVNQGTKFKISFPVYVEDKIKSNRELVEG